jgi:TonB family protein
MQSMGVVRVGCLALACVAGVAVAADTSLETVLAQASVTSATTLGRQYNAVLYAGAGMDNTKAMINLCAAFDPPEDMDGLVVSGVVYPGGVVRHARVMPDTPFARCVARRFVSQSFPPLPVNAPSFAMALLIDVATGHASDPFTSFTQKGSREAITKASAPLYAPRPVYPKTAVTDRATGKTMVLIVFGNLGTPTDVKLETSSGDPRLDSAALDAARHWVFRPTLGRRLSVRVPITFALQTDCGTDCTRSWTPADDQ